MGIEWQTILVGAIVIGAAAYLIRRGWRTLRQSGRGCGGSCGCASASQKKEQGFFVPVDQLAIRQSEGNHESQE
jgi:hypothetical protein